MPRKFDGSIAMGRVTLVREAVGMIDQLRQEANEGFVAACISMGGPVEPERAFTTRELWREAYGMARANLNWEVERAERAAGWDPDP
jgi:hypothetical protein